MYEINKDYMVQSICYLIQLKSHPNSSTIVTTTVFRITILTCQCVTLEKSLGKSMLHLIYTIWAWRVFIYVTTRSMNQYCIYWWLVLKVCIDMCVFLCITPFTRKQMGFYAWTQLYDFDTIPFHGKRRIGWYWCWKFY